MIQKLKVNAVGLSLAIVGGIFYIMCALLSWISPAFIVKLGNYLAHSVDLGKIMKTGITLSSSIMGFILTVVLAYITGILFAWIYNKLVR